MQNQLAVIDRIIAEHHVIREHLKLVGDRVNDVEALFSLQKVDSAWAQSSIETLLEKQKQLIQTINALQEGAQNHFQFEEDMLPPLFGEVLMKALRFEHRINLEQINKTKAITTETKLDRLKPEEMLSKKTVIQRSISNLLQVIEEHAHHEETIFRMIRKALIQENKT